MATDRELSNKLSSGEITSIKVGGTASGNMLTTNDDVDAKVDLLRQGEVKVNSDDIAANKALHFYRSAKASGASTTIGTYSALNSLTVLSADLVGTEYMISLSMLFNYSTTARSAFFRFSLDNGATWLEVRKEVKDTTDNMTENLLIGYTPSAGVDLAILLEYRTEIDGDTLNIPHQHIFVERKI